MAGAPGILAVDRFAFGERETSEVRPEDDLRSLGSLSSSPAEDHVRKLCGSCHLGAPKGRAFITEPEPSGSTLGDLGFASRGGGCSACHRTSPVEPLEGDGALHPGVTSDVPERRCEGCHARSGRISLSFRGLAEAEVGAATRTLPDGRPAVDRVPDVHASRGMTCIDCHTERDVMGDGGGPRHASDAVQARCTDCHARDLPERIVDPDAGRVAEALRRSWIRRGFAPLASKRPIVNEWGTPLVRTDRIERTLWLATTGAPLRLPPVPADPSHQLGGHERLSCQACHSVWAPRCPTCHTRVDPASTGFDHLSGRETAPAWVELAGANGTGAPALALGGSAARGQIVPFVEGMSLVVEGLHEPMKRELWAPLDPHTTGPARGCSSCHPGDSTTYPTAGATTRPGARLFRLDELERVRRVGDCVPCHTEASDLIFKDFSGSLQRLLEPGAKEKLRCPRGAS